MITRYEAWKGGIPLSSIAPEIIITDIEENQPRLNIDSRSFPIGNGSRVLDVSRETLSVTLRFVVRAYDPADRQAIVSEIVKWAKTGNALEVSSRDGLYLECMLTNAPFVKNALKWTDPVTMTFTAYEVPFWQEKMPTKTVLSGISGSVAIVPRGTEKTVLEFSVKNTESSTLDTFQVNGLNEQIRFENLGLSSGATINVSIENGLLMLPVGKRTPESNDFIFLNPNTANNISFSSDKSAQVTFSARGRYS